MDALVAEKPLTRSSFASEPRVFLFTSPYRSIRAAGIAERISVAARDGERRGSLLQNAVSGAFARARRNGQKNPIVLGAIPFDVSQHSCLYLPARYQFVSREALLAEGQAQTGGGCRVVGSRNIPEEEEFKSAVRQAVATFRVGEVKKAVLSRIVEIELARPVDVPGIWGSLMRQNPGGYHFQVPLTDGGVLLGASPELLIRKDGRCIHSNPLAGSAKRQEDSRQDNLASQQLLRSGKDLYEHRLVIDAVRQLLAPRCRVLTVPDAPALMSTPTMWHLSTAISGELKNAETSALQLACLLHPTPAVCGFPTILSRMLINGLEQFDRGLFSGIVGWCDAEGNGEWVITIRCGTVNHKLIRLFAGAGIVAASCPDAEWAEVQAKLGTMLRAFGIAAGREVA